jgi:hypothetical protein
MTGCTVRKAIDMSAMLTLSRDTIVASLTATCYSSMVKPCRQEGNSGMTVITGNAALDMRRALTRGHIIVMATKTISRCSFKKTLTMAIGTLNRLV